MKRPTRKTVLELTLVLLLLMIMSGCLPGGQAEGPKSPTVFTRGKILADPDLNVRFQFKDNQFIITNRNNYDWVNVKMELNSGLISSGYILRAGRIQAGHTYTVGALQFAKPSGERFNPWTTKAQTISISCDGGGFWYGSF